MVVYHSIPRVQSKERECLFHSCWLLYHVVNKPANGVSATRLPGTFGALFLARTCDAETSQQKSGASVTFSWSFLLARICNIPVE